MTESIREYWDQRARENAGAQTATTNDVYQRELEILTATRTLANLKVARGDRVLDVGCGDGYSTLALARAFPDVSFSGVDYSGSMIDSARQAAEHLAVSNLDFEVGDVTALERPQRFSVVVTMRCLINLSSGEAQADAIGRIAKHLVAGGHYLAIENFTDGQDGMNAARAAVGLPPIPVRWHNRFFSEPDFRKWAEPHFAEVQIENFSSAYYFATRVIYSKMCQMQKLEPDYRHPIHELSVNLPPVGNFSPIRLALLRKSGEKVTS